MIIVGAGLSGLIAGCIFPQATIHEAAPEPRESHRALLRFRSDSVAKVTGIDFTPVQVRKGIFMDGKFHEPNIALANKYSFKVAGKVLDRSIWNTETVTRYIAPENFYALLLSQLRNRIQYNSPFDFREPNSMPIISTAPLDVVLPRLNLAIHPLSLKFSRSPITVLRYKLDHFEGVYQTVYFPSWDHPMYRASITGNTLIVELMQTDKHGNPWMFEDLIEAFGGIRLDEYPSEQVDQRYGKITPIDEGWRKSILHSLTTKRNIFSLGRFATWRNILLDDVVQDAYAIKRLMAISDYDRQLQL